MNAVEEQQRRSEIKKVYAGSTEWSKKVDKMSSARVTAIYLRFKSEGRLS